MTGIVVGVDGSEAARAALAWALDEAHQHTLAWDVVHVSSPARVLLARAEGARMLVVGTRGHGGFTGLPLAA